MNDLGTSSILPSWNDNLEGETPGSISSGSSTSTIRNGSTVEIVPPGPILVNNWTLQPFHKSGGCNLNPIIAHESRNEVVLSVQQPISDIILRPQRLHSDIDVIKDHLPNFKEELETSASVVCNLATLIAIIFLIFGGFDESLKLALKILIEAFINVFPVIWLIFSDDISSYAIRKVKNIFQVYLVL